MKSNDCPLISLTVSYHQRLSGVSQIEGSQLRFWIFDARQGEGAKSLKKIFGGVGGVGGLPQGLVGPKKGKIEAYKKN